MARGLRRYSCDHSNALFVRTPVFGTLSLLHIVFEQKSWRSFLSRAWISSLARMITGTLCSCDPAREMHFLDKDWFTLLFCAARYARWLLVSVKQLSPCDKSTAGRRGLITQAVNVSPSGNQEVELSSFFDDVLLLFEC